MKWIPLTEIAQLDAIDTESTQRKVLIFKHSTRCSISTTALNRLERNWPADDNNISVYYLDLLANRSVSNEVAKRYGVTHESPQALIINQKKCIMHQSHLAINAAELSVL